MRIKRLMKSTNCNGGRGTGGRSKVLDQGRGQGARETRTETRGQDEDKVHGRQGQRLEGRRPLRDRGFRDNYCKIYKRLREVGTSEGSIPLR